MGQDDEIKEIHGNIRNVERKDLLGLGFALIARDGRRAFQWRVKSVEGMADEFFQACVTTFSLGKCIVEILVLDREKAITRLRAMITRGYDSFARPFVPMIVSLGETRNPEMAQRAGE